MRVKFLESPTEVVIDRLGLGSALLKIVAVMSDDDKKVYVVGATESSQDEEDVQLYILERVSAGPDSDMFSNVIDSSKLQELYDFFMDCLDVHLESNKREDLL